MNISRRLSSSTLCKRGGGSTRPSTWWRGNSYVAAREPSDFPKDRRGKIPLEERKALVVSYVNEYRAMNSGKFPPPSIARKQVGGNYYIIRKLIQELHHQDTISTTRDEVIKPGKSSNMTTYKHVYREGQTGDPDISSKETDTLSSVQLPFVVTVHEEKIVHSVKNDEFLREAEDIQFFPSESNEKIAENSYESVSSIVGSDKNEVEEIGFFQADVTIEENSREAAANNAQAIETTLDEKMETPSSTGDKTHVANVVDDQIKAEAADFLEYIRKAEDDAKMQDSAELDKLKPEPDQLHQAEKLGTVNRDFSKHHADDADAGNKSNMWDNLKSFAGDIFSFFRKK